MKIVYNPFTNNLDYADTGAAPGYIIQLTGDQGPGTSSDVIKFSGVDIGGTFYYYADTASMTLNVVDGNANTLFGSGTAPITNPASTLANFIFNGYATGSSSDVGPSFDSCEFNCGFGTFLFPLLANGSFNNCFGSSCGSQITNGNSNNIYGGQAFQDSDGSFNCAFGDSTLQLLENGNYNSAFGWAAGSGYTGTESSNILLNNFGNTGESNTLRIGTATGTGDQELNEAFICGINGNTVGSALMVTIDSATDQLGVQAIPSPGSVIPWTDKATSFNAAVNNGYFTTGTITATLPTATEGQVVSIAVDDTNVTSILVNSPDKIRISDTVTSTGGPTATISNTLQGDSVYLVYRASSHTWFSISTEGNWSF